MKLLLLTTLYLSQGLPFGFFTQALPVLLRKEGHSLGAIGLTSLLALPWGAKFLWAPLVDRFGHGRWGRRRSWIVPLQLLAVLLMVALAFYPPTASLAPLLAAVLLTNLFAATQDIATDGLAVEILSERERGIANGIQVGGYRVGMVIGGGALLIVFDRMGWRVTFFMMAALIAVASIPILLFREPPHVVESVSATAPVLATTHFIYRPDSRRILALLMIFKFGEAMAVAMVRPMLIDHGMTLSELGILLGTWGFTAGLVGAVIGGALVNRLGRKRSLLLFAALQALAIGSYALIPLGIIDGAHIYWLSSADHLFVGMATAALFTSMMDWCAPESAATDYTVQASAVVLSTGAASAVSGFIADRIGYPAHFVLGAVLSLLAVPAVAAFYPRRVLS